MSILTNSSPTPLLSFKKDTPIDSLSQYLPLSLPLPLFSLPHYRLSLSLNSNILLILSTLLLSITFIHPRPTSTIETTMASLQRYPRHRHRPSTSRRHTFFLTTSTLLLAAFAFLLSLLLTPSFALPVTLEPRRNPLTLGLGLGGGRGGVGLSLGGNGNSLFNFHHRPRRNLDTRASVEPETEAQAAEKNEAIVASLRKRSSLSGPPTSGAEADSDTTNNDRPLGTLRKGQYHILPIEPNETRPLESGSGEEGGVVRRMVENKKRQHLPRNPPGSGSNYNKGDPYGRRSEE